MSAYTEHRFYSSELDADAVRLSMADERGAEYFAIVEGGSGKAWRGRREMALDAIGNAIRQGWPPGMVTVETDIEGRYR